MKLNGWIYVFLLSCTDYRLKNVDNTTTGAEDSPPPTETDGESITDTTSPTDTAEESIDETDTGEDCIESYVSFDIEEVSTLQDAVSYSVAAWSQDAVVLNFDDSNLTPDQTWRVSAVEILVLISEAHFPHFSDGQEVHIQVFDSNNPNVGSSWTMSQAIVRAEHTWTDYTLPNDAWYAGTYAEYAQKGVWIRFDTRTVIPSSGMTSPQFITGVLWEPPGMVKVGYSNFNQDCERNWTNYGSGWGLNSENPEFFGCSWPMMRIEVEITTPGDCD